MAGPSEFAAGAATKLSPHAAEAKTYVKMQVLRPGRKCRPDRKAHFDYEILERYEAGISLTGTEIKSLRAGRVDLRDAYARVQTGEMWLVNSYIAPYECASFFNHDRRRSRKLLLHKDQIARLSGAAGENAACHGEHVRVEGSESAQGQDPLLDHHHSGVDVRPLAHQGQGGGGPTGGPVGQLYEPGRMCRATVHPKQTHDAGTPARRLVK